MLVHSFASDTSLNCLRKSDKSPSPSKLDGRLSVFDSALAIFVVCIRVCKASVKIAAAGRSSGTFFSELLVSGLVVCVRCWYTVSVHPPCRRLSRELL